MRQGAREGQLSHVRCPACTPISPVSSPSPPATANGYSAASLTLHGACPRCGPSSGPGAGRGVGDRRQAHPCPLPGPQPRTPAARAFADRSQVPAARAAVSPEPSPPAPPQTGPTKAVQGRGAQSAPATRQTLPCGRKTSLHTRPDTHTPGARRGGHLLPVPALLLIAPPIHPPMEVWPPPAPRWVPRPPARSGRTHCLAARAQRLQGPAAAAAAAAAGTETAAAAAAAAAAPAGVSQTGAAKPHRPY
ncbi:predicted GPI-anchored protein 58 [Oryx dammah]|uniref:predicted GPI-anchored protein 58 n=1 Tax=Oryx dammah TaxID=59534 RepID=UPI001A9AB036|nr:predicted GPI-anchored protein 58 [Oryx dammah]